MRTLIWGEPSIGGVTEVGDGDTALLLLEESAYELMLIDVMMPGSSGIAVTHRALLAHPYLRVIVISMQNDARVVEAALAAGARGYLLKDRLDLDLLDALAAVSRGETYLGEGLPKG